MAATETEHEKITKRIESHLAHGQRHRQEMHDLIAAEMAAKSTETTTPKQENA